MSLHIKICGITDPADALASVEAGANAVGFVFFRGSPRRILPTEAQAIAAELPSSVEKVAVFLRPTAAEIDRVLEVFRPDLVQADHQSFNGPMAVPALPVYREGDHELSVLTARRPSRFLYEGRQSGVGETVDWQKAGVLAAGGGMTLAGGLNPGNVADAIQSVRPSGLDVSSGVESMPGVKDIALIREFIDAARQAEREIVEP